MSSCVYGGMGDDPPPRTVHRQLVIPRRCIVIFVSWRASIFIVRGGGVGEKNQPVKDVSVADPVNESINSFVLFFLL